METVKLNKNEYHVFIYDWTELHDDYICGIIKRQPNQDEESDLRFWMFYPCGDTKPINAGDMMRIYKFTAELNKAN